MYLSYVCISQCCSCSLKTKYDDEQIHKHTLQAGGISDRHPAADAPTDEKDHCACYGHYSREDDIDVTEEEPVVPVVQQEVQATKAHHQPSKPQ
uniref:Uncharacterized protein n=1 Tax=Anguilla anguilla TaxID=7936 RepID=A0A0E9XDY6_ANGAN